MLNGQVVANLVTLSRAAEKGKTALLLEGDKDCRVYRKLVDPQSCRVFAAGNRENVESALAILKTRKESGVLGIVDADTDHLNSKTNKDPGLIVTPTRDMECTIFKSAVLGRVLVEFDLEPEAFGNNPEQKAIESAASLALLKFFIDQNRIQVRVGDIEFNKFIDHNTLSCNATAMCGHLASLTITKGIGQADYERALSALQSRKYDPYLVARGHDVSSLVAWAISKRSGKKRKYGANITGHLLESYVRAAYQPEEFATTELCKAIAQWEEDNAPFLVLKA